MSDVEFYMSDVEFYMTHVEFYISLKYDTTSLM